MLLRVLPLTLLGMLAASSAHAAGDIDSDCMVGNIGGSISNRLWYLQHVVGGDDYTEWLRNHMGMRAGWPKRGLLIHGDGDDHFTAFTFDASRYPWKLPFKIEKSDNLKILKKKLGPPKEIGEEYTQDQTVKWQRGDLLISVALFRQGKEHTWRVLSVDVSSERKAAVEPPGCPSVMAEVQRLAMRKPEPAPPRPVPTESRASPPVIAPPRPAPAPPLPSYASDPGAPPLAIGENRDDYGGRGEIDDSCRGYYTGFINSFYCSAPETSRGSAWNSLKQHGLHPARRWCGQAIPAGYWVQYGGTIYVYARAAGSGKAPTCRKLIQPPRPYEIPSLLNCPLGGVPCGRVCCEFPKMCHRNGEGLDVKYLCF